MPVLYGPDGAALKTSQGIPTMPEVTDILNNNWLQWAQAYCEGTLNPDRLKIEDYEAMGATDSDLFAAMEYLKRAVVRRIGDYTHRNEQIHDWMRAQLWGMAGSFIRRIESVLTALEYGFSVTEIGLKRNDDGGVGLLDLQTLHPRSVHLDLHRSGPMKNRLRWIKQWWRQSQWEKDIPISQAIVYTHGEAFGNPYGCSRYKRAWKYWKMKEVLLRAYAVTLERYGSPLSIAKAQDLSGKVRLADGQQMETGRYLTKVMDSLSTKGSMVVPTGVEVEILRNSGTKLGEDFLDALNYLDDKARLAVGAPSLLFGAGKVGSHSLGVEHKDTFGELVDSIADESSETLIEQLCRPLITWQFGPQADGDYGCFLNESFDPEKALKLADLAEKLDKAGLVDMDSLADVNRFREQIGLDLWTEEELQEQIERSRQFPIPPSALVANPDPSADSPEPRREPPGASFAGRRRTQAQMRRMLFRRLSRGAAATA